MNRIEFCSGPGTQLYFSTGGSPNISTAVSVIAKFQSKPTVVHWKMVKHIIRYLIGTKYFVVLLPNRNNGVNIFRWTDADWGSHLSNQTSPSWI